MKEFIATTGKDSLYALVLIIIAMLFSGFNGCQAQEKPNTQKLTVELELIEYITTVVTKRIEILPINDELNKKQIPTIKVNTVNLKRKSVIPEVGVIIKEEDYNENNK